MGGVGSFGLSQLSPDQVAAIQQLPTDSQQSAPVAQPATTGYSSDISSFGAMPINSPTAPGSTGDLESRAAQAPQQLGQQLQQTQQPQQQPGTYSPNNPYASIVSDYQNQWKAMQPAPQTGGSTKRFLSNFFSGMGNSMMVREGLTPPDVRRDQVGQHLMTMTNAANQWEEMQGMSRYRQVLADKMEQDTAFERQMQPLRLQQEQQTVAAGQQQAQTIHPAMSAADLKSLGVPDDLAAQYEGHQLTSADFSALKDLSAAGQTKIFDYGQDGTGQGRGQWLVDRNYQAIKQLSPISETGRATALQKQQFAQQNALLKGMQSPVYAYDPQQKQTVLTTQAQAQQGGMQSVRGVKESDIRNDLHDTRVLNDVAVKSNNMLDASTALDQNQIQRDMINWAMSQGENNLKLAAFGTQIPTGWINTLANSSNMNGASDLTKNYVVGALSLREAAMGLQKVLTGSARANEAQINALQATIPGLETNGDFARQKLSAFTQNVDLLRQGIPRMPGIDVIPIKQWNGPQRSVQQSVGSQNQPGVGNTGMLVNPVIGPDMSGTVSLLRAIGNRERKALGLE
jgi:hypothetical protein